MSWRDRFIQYMFKSLPSAPQSAVVSPGTPVWSQWDYQTYVRDAYRSNPWVFRAIRTIITAAAGIPCRAQIQTSPDNLEELAPTHPLARMMQNPTAMYGFSGWLERMVGAYLLGGQAFAIAVSPDSGPNGGMPLQLIPVPPNHVKPIPGANIGELVAWEYNPKGSPQRLQPEDVFWWAAWEPLNEWDGMPALGPAARSIDTNNEALAYNCSVLQNGGFVGTILTTAANVSEAQAREIGRAFVLEHGGGAKAGKVKIIGGALEAITAGLTPADGALHQTAEDTAIAICTALGVPPQVLGLGESTYSNYQEARTALYVDGVLPILDSLCSALTHYARIVYRDARIVVGYDRDEIEALRENQDSVWTRVGTADWLTVDEKREQTGFGPIGGENGKTILVPGGKVPLEAVVAPPPVPEPIEDETQPTGPIPPQDEPSEEEPEDEPEEEQEQ